MKHYKKIFTRSLALLMVICMVGSFLTMAASAAEIADATIDTTKTGSVAIYKYDLTNAEKDGVWNSSYVSTGVYDPSVNSTLGSAIREGDTDDSSGLGNQESTHGYAVSGVEFTYLKIAEIVQFTESTLDNGRVDNHNEVLYGIPKATGSDFLSAIGLDEEDRYTYADHSDKAGWSKDLWYFQSDVLINALNTSLKANSTTVKNALEQYVKASGTKMALTNEDGYTFADKLPLGLYLFVETACPEYIVDTCDPFLLSLPMTSVSGTNATDGVTRWIYDVTVYPKNLSGIPSLEKTVRENINHTGKNKGSLTDITDGYAHTATASAGDVLDYQIISTLPSITSQVTYLTEYTFIDTVSPGITYKTNDLLLEFFTDEACTSPVPNAKWTAADGFFKVDYTPGTDGSTTMTITMTDAGLAQINTARTVYTDATMVNSGYSDCTLRITYQATLDSIAETVYGDAGNDNTVTLTWRRSNTNHYDSLVDDCHVFTYVIDLTKQFSDGKGDYSKVQFRVQNTSDSYYVKAQLNETEGIYYVTGFVPSENEATIFVPVTSAEVDGKIIIKGLEDDTYVMTEIATADGYTLLAEDIEVSVAQTATGAACTIYNTDVWGLIQNDPRYAAIVESNIPSNGSIKDVLHNMPQKQLAHKHLTATATVDGNIVGMQADRGSDNAAVVLTVVNTRGFDLPQTGEEGSFPMILGGFAFVMVGVLGMCVVLFPRRKKES